MSPRMSFITSSPLIYISSTEMSMVNGTNYTAHELDPYVWNESCPFDIRNHDMTTFIYEFRKNPWKDIGAAEAIKILMYIIVMVVSLVGNSLVILVVFFNQHLRTSTNQYLVNLAVADMLVTLCCTWVHLVRHLTHPDYVLPAILCKLEGFVIATTLTASVFTLTVISIGRFVAVLFPLHAHTSPSRAKRVIITIWILSVIVATPTLVYRELYSIKWANYIQWQCDEFWPVQSYLERQTNRCIVTFDSKKVFNTVFTIILYFIPVTVMISSYSLVIWRLWATSLPGENAGQYAQHCVLRSKKKVVKMVTAVLVAFILCWTPLQSLILYTSFIHNGQKDGALPTWFNQVEYAAYFIAHANSAINPILYCCSNTSFSEGLKALMRCETSPRRRLRSRRSYWQGMTATSRDTYAVSTHIDNTHELKPLGQDSKFLR